MVARAPFRLALLCTLTSLAACGLVTSGTAPDGGGSDPDASVDGSRADGNGSADADAGGTDGEAGAPDAAEAGCPTGLKGPPLVRVEEYCIDATEVTNEQFAEFVSAMADAGTPPAPCDWATGGDSYQAYLPWTTGEEKRPAVDMNWCGAYEYCRWAKKRLCGKRGGGPLGPNPKDAQDKTKSEWFNACSNGGMQPYPYGSSHNPTACNVGTGAVAGVGATAACTARGLSDMVGNVIEWQNACEFTGGQFKDRDCIWQGSSWDSNFDTEPEQRCDTLSISSSSERDSKETWVGFRCCADP